MKMQNSVRRGFTLIELLVVVAIIVTLIAILLPSLARARASAKTTGCMSNMRSLSMVASMYSDENNNWMLPNNWIPKVLGMTVPNPVTTYQKADILMCPSETRQPTPGQDRYTPPGVNYGINMDTITGGPPTYWNNAKIKRTSLESPQVLAYFMDTVGNYYFQHVPPTYSKLYWSPRHEIGGKPAECVGWADGHVSLVAQVDLADANKDMVEDRGYIALNQWWLGPPIYR